MPNEGAPKRITVQEALTNARLVITHREAFPVAMVLYSAGNGFRRHTGRDAQTIIEYLSESEDWETEDLGNDVVNFRSKGATNDEPSTDTDHLE